MKNVSRALPAAIAITLLPQVLLAHSGAPGHTHHGLGAGFTHPLTGLDHMLAMIAVGLWAAQRGGRMIWMLPLAFVTSMALGGVMGIAGVPVPMVESGIAASVLVLGLAVAAAYKFNPAASAALVGVFAFMHGHAHGGELGAGGHAAAYSAGFIAATALLHAAGIALALSLRGRVFQRAIQVGGGAIAVTGLLMIVGIV